MVRLDAALPLIAVFRVSAWAAVNRGQTVQAIPEAIGRPECGMNFYVT